MKLYLKLICGLVCLVAVIIFAGFVRPTKNKPTILPKILGAETVATTTPTVAPISKPKDFAPLDISTSTALNLPILMYHHVGYVSTGTMDSIRIGLTVSPENFEQQVKWLKDNGYNSISLNDLYLYSQKQFLLPKKPVIFTFDDGYDDAFQYAVQILEKYGYTGTFGIITDFPGTHDGTNTYATWDQIVAAKNVGMEIVCHTQNHFDGSNPKFDAAYIFANLSGCQQDLKEHLGATEDYLIYPFGHYTPVYLTQMQKVGFVMGLTVHEGSYLNTRDLLEIPRVRVNPKESMDKFIERLTK